MGLLDSQGGEDYDCLQELSLCRSSGLESILARMKKVVDLTYSQEVQVMLGGGDMSTVRAGVLDKDSERAYRLGQCGALALAISEQTGWPVYWLGRTWCCYDETCDEADYADHPVVDQYGISGFLCACQVEHIGVLHPDGSFIDIDGARTIESAQADRESDVVAPASPLLLADLQHGGRGWPQANMQAAHLFATSIIALLAQQRRG